MEHIKNLLVGIVLGVSNVIPGVSAGTMAVIMNIYDELLDAVSLNINKIKEHFMFLLMIGIGAVGGIIAFSHSISYLFENYPIPTQFAFMGIILGSIPMIVGNVKKDGEIKTKHWVAFLITFIIMLVMVVMERTSVDVQGIAMDRTFMSVVGLFVSGALAAFAMIIPGISGSFIMVTLGTYETVIDAITYMNLPVILITGVGVLVGLFGGVKLVKVLLEKFSQAMYMAILGLVVGSLLVLYPGFAFNMEGILSIGLMSICAFGAYKFSDK
ncbi:MAG: DUF368 domain-containing protein [Cellulosilyticaceae bacterium]